MPKNKIFRYTMFGSLYFTQGTILSYFTALNALYLLSRVIDDRYWHLCLYRPYPLCS
ncbi:MAG: hypothetical protein MAG431_02523 [Chloroflexi bacterium]|nr:hypothetical protein [Chloroflexota bacterium]